jgi:hypothetical protein
VEAVHTSEMSVNFYRTTRHNIAEDTIFIYLCIYIYFYLFIYLITYLFAYLFMYLFIYLLMYYLFIYLFMTAARLVEENANDVWLEEKSMICSFLFNMT